MRRFLGILLVAAAIVSCGKKEKKEIDQGIPVDKGEVREVVEETGQLAPVKSVDVRSEISGQLTEILVDVGDRVTEGQVLARVRGGYEAEDYRIAEIRSPTDGVVIDRDLGPNGKRLEPGDRIRDSLAGFTSGSVLMKIAQLNRMIFEVQVNEMDVARVEKGQTCEVTVEALPDRKYEGRLSRVSPVGKRGERGIRVFKTEVALVGTDEDLRPGMTARARILVDTCVKCVRLPLARYYVEECGGKDVHVAYVAGKDPEKPVRRKLKTGANDGQFIGVTKGLKEGDRVLQRPEGRPTAKECAGAGVAADWKKSAGKTKGKK